LKLFTPVGRRKFFLRLLFLLTGLLFIAAGCIRTSSTNVGTIQDSSAKYYNLEISIVPANTGTVEASLSGSSFTYGTRITFIPTASAGYEFCRWGISLSPGSQIVSGGVDSPLKIDMNSNKVITAYFGISPAVDMSMLNGDTTVRLIDVRPKANYEKEHIPGAISIPFEEIFTRYAEIPIGSRVIVYSDCL